MRNSVLRSMTVYSTVFLFGAGFTPTVKAGRIYPGTAKLKAENNAALTQHAGPTPDPPVRHQHSSAPDVKVPDGELLSLDFCVEIALDKNPLARAAEEGIEVAKDDTGVARAPYYPDLRLQSSYSRWERHAFLPSGLVMPGMSSTIGPTNDWSAGLYTRYTLFDFGQRRAELRAAKARLGAAEQDAQIVQQDIVLDVHQTYFGLVTALEADSAAREALSRSEDHLRLARVRKEVGDVPQADVLRAQVEVADARVALERTRSMVRIAKGELATAMGLPVTTSIGVDRQPRPITSPIGIDLREVLEQAELSRPELHAARNRLEAARQGVAAAKSAYGPKVHGEAGFGWRDENFIPNDKDWAVGVSVELPLFNGFANKHRLARERHQVSREVAEFARLAQKIRLEVWSAHSKLTEAHASLTATETLVADARESVRLATERYGVGAGTMNDLLDADTALTRAEATRIEKNWDYQVAMSEFQRATGELNSENRD